MRYVVVAGLAVLAGCSTSAKDAYLPDGTLGYHVSCRSAAFAADSADCYQKAGDICGAKGYTVVDIPAGGWGDLFIKCKD
jgi:hypothetical protein